MIARTFRLFDKTSNRMLYPKDMRSMGIFLDVSGLPVQYKADRGVFVALQNVVVMWQTGISTMTGSIIYEWDILDIDIPTEFGSIVKAQGVMQWDEINAKWSIHIPKPPVMAPMGEFPVTNAKVLGNTLEHPNLLKK